MKASAHLLDFYGFNCHTCVLYIKDAGILEEQTHGRKPQIASCANSCTTTDLHAAAAQPINHGGRIIFLHKT